MGDRRSPHDRGRGRDVGWSRCPVAIHRRCICRTVIAIDHTRAVEVVASVGVAGGGMNSGSGDNGDDHRTLSAYGRDREREKQAVEGTQSVHRDLYPDGLDARRDRGVLSGPKMVLYAGSCGRLSNSLPVFTAYTQSRKHKHQTPAGLLELA
jgi:hypothetical protein